jgi:hypothetical protein
MESLIRDGTLSTRNVISTKLFLQAVDLLISKSLVQGGEEEEESADLKLLQQRGVRNKPKKGENKSK